MLGCCWATALRYVRPHDLALGRLLQVTTLCEDEGRGEVRADASPAKLPNENVAWPPSGRLPDCTPVANPVLLRQTRGCRNHELISLSYPELLRRVLGHSVLPGHRAL